MTGLRTLAENLLSWREQSSIVGLGDGQHCCAVMPFWWWFGTNEIWHSMKSSTYGWRHRGGGVASWFLGSATGGFSTNAVLHIM